MSFGVVPVLHGRVLLGGAVHQLVRPATLPSRRSQTVHCCVRRIRGRRRRGGARAARALLARRYLLAWFADVEVHFLARTFGGASAGLAPSDDRRANPAIAAAGEPADVRHRQGFGFAHGRSPPRRAGDHPHDALDDALVTAQLLLVLVSKLPCITAPTVRDLVAIAR